MFSIFKKQKKNEEEVDDPGLPAVSSCSTVCLNSNQPDLKIPQLNKNCDVIIDLGNRESGPRRPKLAVSNQ